VTEILIYIYLIYNHNWRNISTIYIYNKTSIRRNILTINKIHRETGRAKDLLAPRYSFSAIQFNVFQEISTSRLVLSPLSVGKIGNKLVPWIVAVLEKLICTWLVKKPLSFMERESSLPYSNILSLALISVHMNPVHSKPSYFCGIRFSIILPTTP